MVEDAKEIRAEVEVGVDIDAKTADDLREGVDHPDEADGLRMGTVTLYGRLEDGDGEFSSEYDLILRKRFDGSQRTNAPFSLFDTGPIEEYVGESRGIDPERIHITRLTAPNSVEFLVEEP